MRMKRLQMKPQEEDMIVHCNLMIQFQAVLTKIHKIFMIYSLSISILILIGLKIKKFPNQVMKKLLLKRFKNFMIFGSILNLGENFNMKKNMMSMKQKIDMREDIWKKKIEN